MTYESIQCFPHYNGMNYAWRLGHGQKVGHAKNTCNLKRSDLQQNENKAEITLKIHLLNLLGENYLENVQKPS
jgi:hypothetical protein